MTFTPKDWRDYPDTTTPITAVALEDVETRLSAYTDQAGFTSPRWFDDFSTDRKASYTALAGSLTNWTYSSGLLVPSGTTLGAKEVIGYGTKVFPRMVEVKFRVPNTVAQQQILVFVSWRGSTKVLLANRQTDKNLALYRGDLGGSLSLVGTASGTGGEAWVAGSTRWMRVTVAASTIIAAYYTTDPNLGNDPAGFGTSSGINPDLAYAVDVPTFVGVGFTDPTAGLDELKIW